MIINLKILSVLYIYYCQTINEYRKSFMIYIQMLELVGYSGLNPIKSLSILNSILFLTKVYSSQCNFKYHINYLTNYHTIIILTNLKF